MKALLSTTATTLLLLASPAAHAAATNGQLAALDNDGLVTFNPDGSGRHVLAAGGGAPVWAPDGNRLAFFGDRTIGVMDVATGAVTHLPNPTGPWALGWSDDGSSILVAGADAVYAVPAAGGDAHQVGTIPSDGNTTLRIVLGPAGRYAVLAGDSATWPRSSSVTLRVGKLDGSGGYSVSDARYDSAMLFLPDGRFAYTNADGDTVVTDGAASPTVISGPGSLLLAASPDGTTLLYQSGSYAYAVAGLDGHTPAPVSAPAPFVRYPVAAWQPCVAGASVSCTSVTPVNPPVEPPPPHQPQPQPVAPKLTALGSPKLDRRGRVNVRVRCDRACSVSLRLSVKLNTGRFLKGKTVKRSGTASKAFKLTLRRGALPKHRRITRVRIVGTVTGADGLRRSVRLAVKR